MSRTQKHTFFALLAVGFVYFVLFFVPNSYGASTEKILLSSSADEYVTYPNVIRILTPGKTFLDTRANLFLYEDYHYGYPFYAASALVLLPVRLFFGDSFTQNMQLNLLLLRQFINILPMITAALGLVFLQTRFQSMYRSLGLFILLLTIRGVVRSHIWWWHPDSLTVLCVVLTLFFLDRDRLRFGQNFYLAAVMCGLATAIKLMGVFFFLTIPFYVMVGVYQRKIAIPKAMVSAAIFVVLMVVTVVVSNPFLFSDEQRARMIEIQVQKREELSEGYSHDDPTYYQKGPQWWESTLEKWYATPIFFAFLGGSLISGCVWGSRRLFNLLVLTWVVPYSLYVLYFVAVKPDHYWLPVLLPLFSCSLGLIDFLSERTRMFRLPLFSNETWRRLAIFVGVLILASQLVLNLFRPISGNIPVYQTAIQTGVAQLRSNP